MATDRFDFSGKLVLRTLSVWALLVVFSSFSVSCCPVFAAFEASEGNAGAENSKEIAKTLTAVNELEWLPKVEDDCIEQLIQAAHQSGFDPRDEIWFIDARQSHYSDIQCLKIYRIANQLFAKQNLADLIDDHQKNINRVTVAYVHGDRTDEFYAQYRGLQVYRNLFTKDCPVRPPVRFIIWSWKSEKEILRPGKDFRIKANRSRCVGQSFASFLNCFPDQRILLTGYSLGCQIFLEAMQEPEILQRKSADETAGYRLALIAPAMEGNFLSSMNCQNSICPPISETHIFDNSRDRVLKLARFHSRRTSPNGGSSIPGLLKNGNFGNRDVFWYDLADSVGPHHAIVNYTQVSIVRKTMQELASSFQMESMTEVQSQTVPAVGDFSNSLPPVEIAE